MIRLVATLYALRTVWALCIAFALGALLMLFSGGNPLAAYSALINGAFLDYWGISGTLVKMSPILLAGLAVILSLRGGLLNLGVEGQIYMGGLFSSIVALYVTGLPTTLHLILAILSGALAGGAWGMIAGVLKAKRGVNEVIVTLLLNFVAINLVSYFAGGPMMQDGAPYPYSEEIPEGLFLPIIMPMTDAHFGVVLGLLIAILLWVLLRSSTLGFSLDLVGCNPQAARYAGVDVGRAVISTMFLSGALGGLAGSFEILGLKHRLYHLFSAGFGFDGIVVAFMAQLNPLMSVIAAFFLSGLKSGALMMQRAIGLESTVVDAVIGIVIICVAASQAFTFKADQWRAWFARRQRLNAALAVQSQEAK
ncbi:ABC transporter permease [Agrobacterium sp. Azo12]|uniref:ABC transporter permease n=1 Tax=Agrobacterium sp. Azo12 TaxID=3031129 RepID=UPI0023D7F6B9|nr:ABC transporter permease [Agrobacterium sp. Azo12]MDO5898100.1 ABC transporter permease [Agrobacterium sp. Azo12]